MKITDEEISKAIPPRSCSCWIDGAKWCREKMEEESRSNAIRNLTHDEKVQEGQEKQPQTIQEAHQMMAEGKIKNASVKEVQEIKDAMRGFYDNALAGEEPFRQKQDGEKEIARQPLTADSEISEQTSWYGDQCRDYGYNTGDVEDGYKADAEWAVNEMMERLDAEKLRGWMGKSELVSDMAKYRETHPLKFGSADPDLSLRLLAVQKTNSLEEAEKVLRWLKGEKI